MIIAGATITRMSRAWIVLACFACANPSPERAKPSPRETAGELASDARAAPSGQAEAVADAPASKRRDAEIEALVREHVAPLVGTTGFPAIEVGVFTDGEEYFVGLGQTKPGTAPDEKTLFHIASLSKQFTALLTALLHVDGVVDVDASLCKDRIKALCGEPATTLRHLLTHSAGLPLVPDDSGDDYTIAKLRAFLKRTEPRARSYLYSTAGYGVIGMVLEERAGASFRELLRKHVLRPLASTAVFELDAASRARVANGQRSNGKAAEASPTRPAFEPSGGLIISAADLLRFAAAHADPDRMPAWRKAIELTREVKTGLRGLRDSSVSAGWHVTASSFYWHLGVASVHRSTMAYDPAHKTAIVVLANRATDVKDTRLEDAAFAVLTALRK